ncbi:hypothetical protein H072_5276 [Dactylellina haptotyla CBS 200.50]|uniref:DUF7587 domain-containing protein n=1 Tax=Dactylellina haptotyla (strain CBS 200.50) TaxID=1284197 RepID=S8BZX9_DACHA|nr:hypothetical protein H072_5276 [Dactylellina haptotyla CBS 200.50]
MPDEIGCNLDGDPEVNANASVDNGHENNLASDKISEPLTVDAIISENHSILLRNEENDHNRNECPQAATEIFTGSHAFFHDFVKELREEVDATNSYPIPFVITEEDQENNTDINLKDQENKEVEGVYSPSPRELDFSSGSRIYPETPASQHRPAAPIATDLKPRVPLDDDSGYETARKRVKLSIKEYKAKRTIKNSKGGGDDRHAFDRISPNSKFFRTSPNKSVNNDPIRRVLFKKTPRKKSSLIEAINADCDLNTYSISQDHDVSEPTIIDPLARYRHTWKDRDLQLLYVLRRWFSNGPSNVRDIMNRCLAINISSGAYGMQFDEYWVKQKERNIKTFEEVFIDTPFADPDGKWDDIKQEIQAAAEGAHISLKISDKDHDQFFQAYREVKAQKCVNHMKDSIAGFFHTPKTSPVLIPLEDSDEEPDVSVLNTPSKIPAKQTSSNSKKRKADWLLEKPETPKRQSTDRRFALATDILFRYMDDESFGYNSSTLIRAGLFRDPSQPVPEPLEADDPLFDDHSANHINRKKIPTPLISTSNSLMWVMRKANTSRRYFNATNPRIAVIDPKYLKKTYRVSDFIKGLCKRQEMIDAAHRYGGHFDILVWAEIPKEAIVNTIDYVQLLRATTVPRHIHTHFRMDIVARKTIPQIMYGIKFAVVCSEELGRAVEDFAAILLGEASGAEIKEKFLTNVRTDWELERRNENQNVSKYFLPYWTQRDAEILMDLDPTDDQTQTQSDMPVTNDFI